MRPTKIFWLLLPLFVFLDQASKHWVETVLSRAGQIVVIPDVFYLTYVRNTGVAFGLLAGRNGWLAAMVILVVVLGMIWAAQLNWKKREVNILAAMLLAGAIGNLADRLRHGYVVDFFDFHRIGYPWVFNLADSCITLSLVWIIFRQVYPGSQRDVGKK